MASTARTIVLTAKGIKAICEMRLHNTVPVVPEHGWTREPRPKATKAPTPELPSRKEAIQNAQGRDVFLSPAFILPGDRLLRIAAGERVNLGTISHVDKVGGATFRIFLSEGGWKTCGVNSAILVAPRDK